MLIEAHAEQVRDEYDAALWAGWHTALFYRAKTLPSLKSLFKKREYDPSEVKETDDEDQREAKRLIAVMMGASKAKSITFENDSAQLPN